MCFCTNVLLFCECDLSVFALDRSLCVCVCRCGDNDDSGSQHFKFFFLSNYNSKIQYDSKLAGGSSRHGSF